MHLHHLLVIDDDDELRRLLAEFVAREGYAVSAASSAAEASEYMAIYRFDLIVLDVTMPGENGVDFLKRIRKGNGVPVIMLTAMNETDDRIKGLEAGADDYLAKPFAPKELLLRIAKILERAGESTSAAADDDRSLHIGRYRYDATSQSLRLDGNEINLSERDKTLLSILAQHIGRPVSREFLAESCGVNERSVDVGVARLRTKLEPDPKNPVLLHTVRGAGYKLNG